MVRVKKNKPGGGNTKLDRATRRARRAEQSRRNQQAVADRDAHLDRQLNEHLAGLHLSWEAPDLTFGEEKMSKSTARHDRVEKQHVPVEKEIQEELLKSNKDLAKYKMVYMVDPSNRLLVLRFPGRAPDQPYCARNGNKPTELRIKPKHGHVELDIPIDIHSPNWDKEKAIKYQMAMRKSATLQKGSSYDMAGGFGVNDEPEITKKSKASKEPKEDTAEPEPSMEYLLANVDEANEKGYVMNKITLGGRIEPYNPDAPRLMAGTFKGDVLYLSHVDAVVELTANFQHLDALADLEKTSARHQRNTEKGKEKERDREAADEEEARAVELGIKGTEFEPDEGMPEMGGHSSIKELLEDMADEPWQRMKWIDQDDPDSYRRFDEHFGIGKDVASLPTLVSTMTPEQWLDHISIPRYDHTTKKYREMTFPRKNKNKKDKYVVPGLAKKTSRSKKEEYEEFDENDPRDHEEWIYEDENPEKFESASEATIEEVDPRDPRDNENWIYEDEFPEEFKAREAKAGHAKEGPAGESDEDSDEESDEDDEIPEEFYYETEDEEEAMRKGKPKFYYARVDDPGTEDETDDDGDAMDVDG